MPVSWYKELPEGHPFKGAHVFFNLKPQASSEKSSTAQNPQEGLVQALEAKGIRVELFLKETLHRK